MVSITNAILLGWICAIVAPIPVFGQVVDPITVAQVSIKPQANGAGDDVEIVYRNGSAKRITAYVVFLNAYAGDALVDTVAQQYVSNDPPVRSLAPGLTMTQQVTVAHPPGKPATRVAATVDWVLFEDGTEAGPNKSGWGVRMKAEMQGAYRERVRLRKMLEEQGMAAVEQELRRAGAAATASGKR